MSVNTQAAICNKTSLRERHAAAIQERDDCEISLNTSLAVFDRAEALIAQLSNDVERMRAGHEFRAEKLAKDLAKQLRNPDVSIVVHPTNEASPEQLAALNHLEIAEQARQQLECEADNALYALEAAEKKLRESAFAIIRTEVEEIVDAIEQHNAELQALRSALVGLDTASYAIGQEDDTGQWQRPSLVNYRAVTALQTPVEPQYVPGCDPAIKHAEAWKTFFNALLTDATAVLAQPKE